MTAANTDAIKQSVKTFKNLNTDEQLATLALLYTKVSGSVSRESVAKASSSEVEGIVSKIEELSQERQVDALRDLLPANKTDQDEITLDPNPSKALTELVSGGNTVPTAEYGSLSAESKLAFWYHVGQKLGNKVTAIPTEYNPTSKVKELVESLSSLDVEQQVSFLTQVM